MKYNNTIEDLCLRLENHSDTAYKFNTVVEELARDPKRKSGIHCDYSASSSYRRDGVTDIPQYPSHIYVRPYGSFTVGLFRSAGEHNAWLSFRNEWSSSEPTITMFWDYAVARATGNVRDCMDTKVTEFVNEQQAEVNSNLWDTDEATAMAKACNGLVRHNYDSYTQDYLFTTVNAEDKDSTLRIGRHEVEAWKRAFERVFHGTAWRSMCYYVHCNYLRIPKDKEHKLDWYWREGFGPNKRASDSDKKAFFCFCRDLWRHGAGFEVRNLPKSDVKINLGPDPVNELQSYMIKFVEVAPDGLLPLTSSEEPTVSKLNKIEKKTFVNDVDVAHMSSNELISLIKNTKAEIADLESVDVDSKHIKQRIADANELVEQAVAILDTK